MIEPDIKYTELDIVMLFVSYGWTIHNNTTLSLKTGYSIDSLADLSEGDMVFVKKKRVLK